MKLWNWPWNPPEKPAPNLCVGGETLGALTLLPPTRGEALTNSIVMAVAHWAMRSFTEPDLHALAGNGERVDHEVGPPGACSHGAPTGNQCERSTWTTRNCLPASGIGPVDAVGLAVAETPATIAAPRLRLWVVQSGNVVDYTSADGRTWS